MQAERSATAALRAAGRAALRGAGGSGAAPPARPPEQRPRRGPRPAHLRLRGFPRKKTPLPPVLPVPPAAPRSPRGAPAAAAPAAAPTAGPERRPPAPQRCGGSRGRAVPRGAASASRRSGALRLRVLRAAAVSAGERRITKASLRAAAAAAAAQAAVTSGNNAAASPPARRPLKAHGALPGAPAAGPGMDGREGVPVVAPALHPSAAGGSLWHCPRGRGAEPILRLTAPSLPPARPPPPSSPPSAARKTRRPPGREPSSGPAPRGRAGPGGLRVHRPGRTYEPWHPPRECFRQKSGPSGARSWALPASSASAPAVSPRLSLSRCAGLLPEPQRPPWLWAVVHRLKQRIPSSQCSPFHSCTALDVCDWNRRRKSPAF